MPHFILVVLALGSLAPAASPGAVGDAVDGLIGTVEGAVEDVIGTVEGAVEDVTGTVEGAVEDVTGMVEEITGPVLDRVGGGGGEPEPPPASPPAETDPMPSPAPTEEVPDGAPAAGSGGHDTRDATAPRAGAPQGDAAGGATRPADGGPAVEQAVRSHPVPSAVGARSVPRRAPARDAHDTPVLDAARPASAEASSAPGELRDGWWDRVRRGAAGAPEQMAFPMLLALAAALFLLVQRRIDEGDPKLDPGADDHLVFR